MMKIARTAPAVRGLALAMALASPGNAADAPAPSTGRPAPDVAVANKARIAAAYARWIAGGRGFYDEVLARDMTWTIMGTGRGAGTYRGRDAFERDVIAPFAALLATPIKPVVHGIWADGDDVVVRWSGTATTKRGRPYANDYVWIFHMRDGRADRVEAFLDLPRYQAVFVGR